METLKKYLYYFVYVTLSFTFLAVAYCGKRGYTISFETLVSISEDNPYRISLDNFRRWNLDGNVQFAVDPEGFGWLFDFHAQCLYGFKNNVLKRTICLDGYKDYNHGEDYVNFALVNNWILIYAYRIGQVILLNTSDGSIMKKINLQNSSDLIRDNYAFIGPMDNQHFTISHAETVFSYYVYDLSGNLVQKLPLETYPFENGRGYVRLSTDRIHILKDDFSLLYFVEFQKLPLKGFDSFVRTGYKEIVGLSRSTIAIICDGKICGLTSLGSGERVCSNLHFNGSNVFLCIFVSDKKQADKTLEIKRISFVDYN